MDRGVITGVPRKYQVSIINKQINSIKYKYIYISNFIMIRNIA